MNFSDIAQTPEDPVLGISDMLSPEYNSAAMQLDEAEAARDNTGTDKLLSLVNPLPDYLDRRILALIDSIPLA